MKRAIKIILFLIKKLITLLMTPFIIVIVVIVILVALIVGIFKSGCKMPLRKQVLFVTIVGRKRNGTNSLVDTVRSSHISEQGV